MGQAITKIKALSLGADDQTFPPNDAVNKPKDNDVEWDKYNASQRSQQMYRCSNDLWKVEGQTLLVDPVSPKVVHRVGKNADPKVRDRAVSAGAIRRPSSASGQYGDVGGKMETASSASPRMDGRAEITRYDPSTRKWLKTIW